MGLNDTHFTSPERTGGWSLEQHQNEVGFRQQLASVFQPAGPHNVRMETGHTLLPITHPDALGPGDVRGPQVVVSHRNDPDAHFSLPLGNDPAQWMGNLARHLNSREVMSRMREQMSGPYGDE
jgi:hypothetical protein